MSDVIRSDLLSLLPLLFLLVDLDDLEKDRILLVDVVVRRRNDIVFTGVDMLFFGAGASDGTVTQEKGHEDDAEEDTDTAACRQVSIDSKLSS